MRHLQEIFDSILLASIFYAAIGLLAGKRHAWQAATVILGLSLVWEVLKVHDGYLSIPVLLVTLSLVLLIINRGAYRLRTEFNFIKPLRLALLITLITTTLSCLIFFISNTHHHQHFDFTGRLLHSLDAMYSLDSFSFQPTALSLESVMVTLLGYVGIFNYSIVALAIAGPIVDRSRVTRLDRRHTWRLLEQYSHSSEDYFKYWPADKSYFFSPKATGVIAYKTHGNNSVALADPIAPTRSQQLQLINDFRVMADIHGWRSVFLHVPPESASLYGSNGFELLKIGENAIVNCDTFVHQTSQNKNFRNISNRFKNKHLATVTIAHPPHSSHFIQELSRISEEWLDRNGRKEHTFAMGYFDRYYLNNSRIACLKDQSGQIFGFVTLQPNFSRSQASVDLIRTASTAPSNSLDYILMTLISQAYEEGYRTFDLGLAPLAGLEDSTSPEGLILHSIYAYTTRWFAFSGLRRFKDKFAPEWQPSYLAYSGSRTALPSIAVSLSKLLDTKD